MLKKSITCLPLLVMLLAACVSSRQYIPLADATTTSDAKVYAIRTSALSSAIPFAIYCDSLQVGKLGPKGYLCWTVRTGTHQLGVAGETQKDYSLMADAGKVYYFKAVPQMGLFIARAKLVPITPAEALTALKKTQKPILELDALPGKP